MPSPVPTDPKEKEAFYKRQYEMARETNIRKSIELYWKRRTAVIIKLGGRCSNPDCKWMNDDGTIGCTDERCLQIDHVDSGGSKERKKIAPHTLLKKVLEDKNGSYQLLCANCNWIKRKTHQEIKPSRFLKAA